MATVTAIKQQVKTADRYSIYVDGKYRLSLSTNQLAESGLASGQELDEVELSGLLNKSVFGKALMAAYRLLSYRQRSCQELKQRLIRKDYDEPIVEAVLDHLTELKLISDEEFTVNWLAQSKSSTRSRQRLTQELRQKGIDPELAREQLDAMRDDHEAKAIKSLIGKKLHKNDSIEKQRLIGQLARQGFGYSAVQKVLTEDFSEVRWR